jgi:hypothetical protein
MRKAAAPRGVMPDEVADAAASPLRILGAVQHAR